MILTLEERAEAATTRRRAAIAAVCARLSRYAKRYRGRFLVYGSVARDAIRADSDIDILVDFPTDRTSDAWRYAEFVCGRYDVPHDIMPLSWCSDRFRQRIEPLAMELK